MALVLAFGAGASLYLLCGYGFKFGGLQSPTEFTLTIRYILFGNYEQDAGDSRSHNYSR